MSTQDVDIFRFAKDLIELYGEEAPMIATARTRNSRARNDKTAESAWRSVLQAVEILNLFGPVSYRLLR